ncbi:hypothetical protein LMG19087_04899 [Ralstonia wenshanensis]|nr:hypothetical protein LMG19087_04899 [Ralstonia wenshanensis]
MNFRGPVFTTPPSKGAVGDALGINASTERLYGGVFPGMNNAVRHVRVYSTLCWAVNTVWETLDGRRVTAPELRRTMSRMLWKMQLLLSWSATVAGESGFPGKSRFDDAPGTVTLTREAFPDVATSFLDDVWYRPSLVGGFRFLEAGDGRDKGTYKCTPAGKKLAKAYEDVASQWLSPKLFTWLKSSEDVECTLKRLEKLRPVLSLTKPDPAEIAAFVKQFYDVEPRRHASILLALRSLEALEADRPCSHSTDRIRHTMAAGMTPFGRLVDMDGISKIQGQWTVLQLRALQRLALDTMLSLLEREIFRRECDGLSRNQAQVVEGILDAFKKEGGAQFLSGPLSEPLEHLKEFQGQYPTLQQASMSDEKHRFYIGDLKTRLRSLSNADWATAQPLPLAVQALLVCAAEAQNLAKNPEAAKHLGSDPGRCSLKELASAAQGHLSATGAEFVAHVFYKFVIGQHLRVAKARSYAVSDGADRFVFALEDAELSRNSVGISPDFVRPGDTADTLYNVLLLLANSRKLEAVGLDSTDKGPNRVRALFRLKPSGRQLLKKQS